MKERKSIALPLETVILQLRDSISEKHSGLYNSSSWQIKLSKGIVV